MPTKIIVPHEEFRQVAQAIKNSGVKFYPFLKYRDGYHIEFEPANHPLVSYLILKYDGIRVTQNS